MKNATITLFALVAARLIMWLTGFASERVLEDLFPLAMFWLILFALWNVDRCFRAVWVHGGYRFIGKPEDIAEVKRVMRHMQTE